MAIRNILDWSSLSVAGLTDQEILRLETEIIHAARELGESDKDLHPRLEHVIEATGNSKFNDLLINVDGELSIDTIKLHELLEREKVLKGGRNMKILTESERESMRSAGLSDDEIEGLEADALETSRRPGESDESLRGRIRETIYAASPSAFPPASTKEAPELGGVLGAESSKILAELTYEFDGSTWSALVTKQEGTHAGFQLWYKRGERFQKSGTFQNAKALKKYVRETADKKFGGYVPKVDTLDRLRNSSAQSVVPNCFQVEFSENKMKCVTCPYRRKCENPDTLNPYSLDDVGSLDELEAKYKKKESDEDFRARLKAKVKAKWGDVSGK